MIIDKHLNTFCSFSLAFLNSFEFLLQVRAALCGKSPLQKFMAFRMNYYVIIILSVLLS